MFKYDHNDTYGVKLFYLIRFLFLFKNLKCEFSYKKKNLQSYKEIVGFVKERSEAVYLKLLLLIFDLSRVGSNRLQRICGSHCIINFPTQHLKLIIHTLHLSKTVFNIISTLLGTIINALMLS